MLTENLYREVLLAPAKKGADTLYIVSGYASAGMADQHIREVQGLLKSRKSPVQVNLIVGMTAKDGIQESAHLGFVSLMDKTMKGVFTCGYIPEPPPIHAKVYAWFRGDKPVAGHVGSANYTQQGFLRNQREVMALGDPVELRGYYQNAAKMSCLCTHQDVQGLIKKDDRSAFAGEDVVVAAPAEEKVTVDFLDGKDELPARSSLNWGQRPEHKREPNQAYIPLTAKIYRSGFFPPLKEHFTLHTDDGQVIICVRGQTNGKAILSTENNSIMGEYFRRRLGVKLGAPVVRADLEKYGRTDVVIHKIDDDNYYMDFSVPCRRAG